MSATHSRTALEALNRMLYKDLGFVGNEDDYYNPHNSYIDKVGLTHWTLDQIFVIF